VLPFLRLYNNNCSIVRIIVRAAVRIAVLTVLVTFGIFGIVPLIPSTGLVTSKAPQVEGAGGNSESRPAPPANPVVVELFTSEGCSDCPPADRLLYRLEQTQPVPGAQIIPLEQHVDYWDDEGWRDPFSSSQFTLRQRNYVYTFNLPTPYTPEMVVDGTAEFVGSDVHRALAAIVQAARTPKANLQIEQLADATSDPRTVSLHVSLAASSGWNAKHGADVLLAITEDNLPSNVTAGENAGAHMDHRAVVRELRVLGRVESAGVFSAAPELRLAGNWRRENLHVVAFVQDRSTRRILGASMLSLSEAAK
jgi:hypothetical protein